jgi:predicted Zn-dependent protease
MFFGVGIDPEGIPALFSVLIDQRKSEPTIVDAWFASHPLEESRIANAKHLIRTIGADQKGGLLQDTPTYHAFLDRVRSLPPPPRPPCRPRRRGGWVRLQVAEPPISSARLH